MMILCCFSLFLPGPLGPRVWHQPTNFACTAANGDTDTSSTIVPQPYVSIRGATVHSIDFHCPNLSLILFVASSMHDRMLSEPPHRT